MRPGFFLAEALRSIRANAAISIAATVTVLIAVFILGAFIPSFLYVQNTVDQQKDKVDINVFIADSATVQQVNGLQRNIDGLREQGLVRESTYVSKDDALADLRERLRDPSVLEELPSNPLPASFNVLPADPGQSQQIVVALQGHPAVDADLGISFASDTADRLLTVARVIQYAGGALILVLLVASILLIGNTIRLSFVARRREVEVMKLVGATNWFIRWPFVIEGILFGLAGATVAVAMLFGIKVLVVDSWAADADSALTRNDAGTIGFLALAAILVAAGAIVGALGSGITLRRFLRV